MAFTNLEFNFSFVSRHALEVQCHKVVGNPSSARHVIASIPKKRNGCSNIIHLVFIASSMEEESPKMSTAPPSTEISQKLHLPHWLTSHWPGFNYVVTMQGRL